MAKCPYVNCHNEVITLPDDSPDRIGMCPICENPVIKCPACGGLNRILAQYCRMCGRKLDWDEIHSLQEKRTNISSASFPTPTVVVDISRCFFGEERELMIWVTELHGLIIVQIENGCMYLLNPFKSSAEDAVMWSGKLPSVDFNTHDCFVYEPVYHDQIAYLTSNRQILKFDLLNISANIGSIYRTPTSDICITQKPYIVGEKMLFSTLDTQSGRCKLNVLDLKNPQHLISPEEDFDGFMSEIIPVWDNDIFFFDKSRLYRYTFSDSLPEKVSEVDNPVLSNGRKVFEYPGYPQSDGDWVFVAGWAEEQGYETRAIYCIDERLNINMLHKTRSSDIKFSVQSNPLFIFVTHEQGIKKLKLSGQVQAEEYLKYCAEFAPRIYGRQVIFNNLVSSEPHSENLQIYDLDLNPIVKYQVDDIIAQPCLFLDRLILCKEDDARHFITIHEMSLIR